MTMKFTLEDTARVQRHLRTMMNGDGLTVSQSFEIGYEVFSGTSKPTNGHYVNDRGELKPIPGAVTSYDRDGRPVIACPLPEKPASKRKLVPVTIDSLCEVDGDVDLAEVSELLPPDPVRVAGQDDEMWEDAVLSEDSAETSDAGSSECE
jgi:hypothetical protein